MRGVHCSLARALCANTSTYFWLEYPCKSIIFSVQCSFCWCSRPFRSFRFVFIAWKLLNQFQFNWVRNLLAANYTNKIYCFSSIECCHFSLSLLTSLPVFICFIRDVFQFNSLYNCVRFYYELWWTQCLMYDASRKMMFRFTEHPKTAVVTKQIPGHF